MVDLVPNFYLSNRSSSFLLAFFLRVHGEPFKKTPYTWVRVGPTVGRIYNTRYRTKVYLPLGCFPKAWFANAFLLKYAIRSSLHVSTSFHGNRYNVSTLFEQIYSFQGDKYDIYRVFLKNVLNNCEEKMREKTRST